MSKLFVFGDSFSEQRGIHAPYSIWKGYSPDTYPHIISKKLEIPLFNFSHGGFSNSDIFQSVCQNVDKIEDGDIVIIGWSGLARFRLANPKLNRWLQFQPGIWEMYSKLDMGIDGLSESTIDEILYNRSHFELHREEILDWIKLLSKVFERNTFINFTWCTSDWGLKPLSFETIKEETNEEIDDSHWSENGHMVFAKSLLDVIGSHPFENKFVNINNYSYISLL